MTAQSDNVQSCFNTTVNFQPWFTNAKKTKMWIQRWKHSKLVFSRFLIRRSSRFHTKIGGIMSLRFSLIQGQPYNENRCGIRPAHFSRLKWKYWRVLWARSIQPKFPGRGSKIFWCRMDRNGSERSRSIPLAKRVSRSFKWRMLDHCCSYSVRWWFRRWYQWCCVSCFMLSTLTSITGYFEETVPRYFLGMSSNTTFEWRKEHSKFSRKINRLQEPLTAKTYTWLA